MTHYWGGGAQDTFSRSLNRSHVKIKRTRMSYTKCYNKDIRPRPRKIDVSPMKKGGLYPSQGLLLSTRA